MSQYVESKLLSIEYINFMTLKRATVFFDINGNITNIVGYNDSGKSAIRYGIGVILYDAYSSMQSDFVTYGEEYFELIATFNDGVIVRKHKIYKGASIWEMTRNGAMVYTNRKAGGKSIISVEELPEPIAQYMNVVRDKNTNEMLNLRSRDNKALLIGGTGGENYKVLNGVLQSEHLSEAGRLLQIDKNAQAAKLVSLQSQISNAVADRDELAMIVPSDDKILELEQNRASFKDLSTQYSNLVSVCEARNKVDEFVVWDELQLYDSSQAELLEDIARLRGTLAEPIYDELPYVDIDRLAMMREILAVREAVEVPVAEELSYVDVDRFSEITEIGELFAKASVDCAPELTLVLEDQLLAVMAMANSYRQIHDFDAQLASLAVEISEIESELKQCAEERDFKICSTCGSVVM